MKKILWLLLLVGTGCGSALLLNSFRFPEGNKFAALSSPTPITASSPVSQRSPSSSLPVAETPVLYRMGQTVKVENMALRVVGVQSLGKSLSISKNETLEATGTWQAVAIEVTNTDNQGNSLATTEFYLKASKENSYPLSDVASAYYSTIASRELSATNQIIALRRTELPPSVPARIYLLFDVKSEAENLQLMIKPLSQSSNKEASVDL